MFNEIIDQMDTLCLETAQKCKGAYENLRACEDASRAKQRPDESEVKYKARMATAAAALEDAQNLQRNLAYNLPQDAEAQGQALRRQLEVAIAEKFSANPSDVDPNTLTLLQSGILTPPEYVRLFDRATSSTMRRPVLRPSRTVSCRSPSVFLISWNAGRPMSSAIASVRRTISRDAADCRWQSLAGRMWMKLPRRCNPNRSSPSSVRPNVKSIRFR